MPFQSYGIVSVTSVWLCWLGIDCKECVKKVPGGVSFKYGFIYGNRIIFRKFSAARYFSRLEYFACFFSSWNFRLAGSRVFIFLV